MTDRDRKLLLVVLVTTMVGIILISMLVGPFMFSRS
jgi:hypothetical protein